MSTEFSTLEYFHGKKNSQDEKVIILIIVCKADNSWKKNSFSLLLYTGISIMQFYQLLSSVQIILSGVVWHTNLTI